MSSLSDFARGGAVDGGTGSTRTSPTGSHHGASDSLLPSLPSAAPEGMLERQVGDDTSLALPSLTAGGTRSNSLATPRQLDTFMHGNDNASAGTGDWHDAVESTVGSLGGESRNNGVARVFCVKEGAGKDMCCGYVGTKGGSRFCTTFPSECKFKNHDKKANVKPNHVYLGSDSGKKSSGWLGWCMPVDVFGGRETQLAGLGLDGSQFRRFAETLHGLHVGGKVDMASVSWDPILDEINKPLEYGATPLKVQFSMGAGGALESTGLSNWMTLDTPGSDGGEDGTDSLAYKSSEDDYTFLEKVTTLSANSEVLREALEQLSSANGKTSTQIGEMINILSSQIHDVSVRVGDNPGFVGSKHDSAWNGITRVQENLDSRVSEHSSELMANVKSRFDLSKIEINRDNSIRDGKQRDTDRDNSIRDAKQLEMEKQLQILQASIGSNSSLISEVASLKREVKRLEHASVLQAQDLSSLKLTGSSPSMPPRFLDDWQLVFDFFMRNTTPSAPPLVGNVLEKSVRENSSEVRKLALSLANASLSSGPAPSLTSSFTSGGPNWAPRSLGPPGDLAALDKEVQELKARMSSKSVTIDTFTFPTLAGTRAWATANLPSSPNQANLCLDVVALLHSIGRSFASVEDSRAEIYQNQKAGVSTMALTVASSFHTVLPQILGKHRNSLGEDVGLLLPCASKYSEWFDNSSGIPTGIKPRILEGLSTQMDVYQEAIRELAYSHPVGAAMAKLLLQRAYDFAILLLGLIDTMWNEYSSRSGEVSKEEAWLIICALVRQLFREFSTVRRPGAAVTASSPACVGTTWWYVLQTHRLMDEFTASNIRRHPSLIPVFTAHLDRNRVTTSTHATLVDKVRKVDIAVAAVTAAVNRLNGTRGNPGGRGAGGGAAVGPP